MLFIVTVLLQFAFVKKYWNFMEYKSEKQLHKIHFERCYLYLAIFCITYLGLT